MGTFQRSQQFNNYHKSMQKLRQNTLVQGNYPADCDVNEIGGYLTECTVSPPSSLNVEQSSGQALLARFICLPGMFLVDQGFADKTGKQKQEVSPTFCLRSWLVACRCASLREQGTPRISCSNWRNRASRAWGASCYCNGPGRCDLVECGDYVGVKVHECVSHMNCGQRPQTSPFCVSYGLVQGKKLTKYIQIRMKQR